MIKKITATHLNQLYSLSKQSFNNEPWFTKKYLKNILESESSLCLGSFCKNENNKECLSGTILLYILEYPKVWIELLVVDTKFRRKKIATALLNTALNKIKKKKYFLALVDVSRKKEFNQARKFWKKNYFTKTCIIKDWYGKGDDTVLYTRNIS